MRGWNGDSDKINPTILQKHDITTLRVVKKGTDLSKLEKKAFLTGYSTVKQKKNCIFTLYFGNWLLTGIWPGNFEATALKLCIPGPNKYIVDKGSQVSYCQEKLVTNKESSPKG